MHLEVILFVIAVLAVYLFGKSKINHLVRRIGKERNIDPLRINYVNAVLSIVFTLITLIAIGTIIGVGYDDIGLFFGSMFAVLGVALFAQWSILSNLTASVIVFFFFPYRVGDKVKILDGDNTVEGEIIEITLFHVILSAGDTLITYPNSMVFQKAVVITAERHQRLAAHTANTREASSPPNTSPNPPPKGKTEVQP